MSFTVVSLFAGCGGSSLGYHWAGGKVLLAVEWDSNAVQTYMLNFPDTPVYPGDICKLTVEDTLRLIGLQSGELDVLDGSPPCQGFSTAGKRKWTDDRNQLFREYVRLLQGLGPKVFIMENVSGMAKEKMKLVFAEAMRELKASGYHVKCRLLNAMYYGVPQSRERVIFIGVREDLGIEPSHPKAQGKPVTAGEALEGVRNNAAEVAFLLAAGLKYAAYQSWPDLKPGQRRDSLGLSGFNCVKYHPNKPARTTLKSDGHITRHGAMHWLERRRFTVAEFKRFCSFPDNFSFVGGWAKEIQVMGNSVPPRFMQAIAEHVRDNILVKCNA